MSEVHTGDAMEGVSTLMILSPETEEIEVGGKKVLVAPLKIGQLGRFSKAIKSILPSILMGMKPDGTFDLMKLINESLDTMVEAVAIGCNQPVEWVAGLDTVEFIKLAGKIMVVNVDFFVRRLPQMTSVVAESLAAVSPDLKQKVMSGAKQFNG